MANEDILSAIEAGPAGGAVLGVQRGPIGIQPEGEVELAERNAPPPRYMEGFELFPGSKGPEWVARLQEALDAAGLYTDGYAKGVWDPENDAKAFKTVLGVANANGLTWQDALVELGKANAQSQAVGGRGRRSSGGGGGITVEVTSPGDLRRLADRVARSTIGKRLEPDQLDRFVQAYQQIEQGAAQQQILAAQSAGANVITGAPQPENFFEDMVQRQMPGEAMAHKMVEKFAVFEDLLRGPGIGARPSETGGTVGV